MMRRHEAIKILQNIVVQDALQEDYDAIDVAIEALTALDLVDEQNRTDAYKSGYVKGWLDRARKE